MTSSSQIADLYKNYPDLQFAGGYGNDYLIPGATKRCHPDFEAIAIGDPNGFVICHRRETLTKPLVDLTQFEPNKTTNIGSIYDTSVVGPTVDDLKRCAGRPDFEELESQGYYHYTPNTRYAGTGFGRPVQAPLNEHKPIVCLAQISDFQKRHVMYTPL